MLKQITLLTLLSLSTSASAMLCPNNFNTINLGDSIQQIELQCGKPDGIKISKADANVPQEWNFYVHPQMKRYTAMRTNAGQEASVKMAVAFKNDKVVNITVNGMSLAATTICGPNIAVEDSSKTVKNACGDPIFVDKSSQSNGEKPIEMTEYKYNSSPPGILIFADGKLIEKK